MIRLLGGTSEHSFRKLLLKHMIRSPRKRNPRTGRLATSQSSPQPLRNIPPLRHRVFFESKLRPHYESNTWSDYGWRPLLFKGELQEVKLHAIACGEFQISETTGLMSFSLENSISSVSPPSSSPNVLHACTLNYWVQ